MVIPKSSNTSPVEAYILPNVTPVNELKFLGVLFNGNLNWNSHITAVVKNASQKMYAMRKLKPVLSRDDLKAAYYGCVRSILEYCAPAMVGMPSYLLEKLQHVQNRFHGILCGYDSACKPDDCLPPLAERFTNATVKLFTKIEQNELHILHRHLPDRSTRSGRYITPLCRTTRRQHSFFYSCVKNFTM